MSRRRRAGGYAEADISRIMEESTCGGMKNGTGVTRKMPVLSGGQGIKMAWDNRADEYPSIVQLQMTDGEWIEYQVVNRQPGFIAAMNSLKSGAWEQGYPSKKR